VEYRTEAVYDAIRDAAVETKAAIVYLKRRVLSLEDVYLAEQESDPALAQLNSRTQAERGE
jgi:hypothetical protein